MPNELFTTKKKFITFSLEYINFLGTHILVRDARSSWTARWQLGDVNVVVERIMFCAEYINVLGTPHPACDTRSNSTFLRLLRRPTWKLLEKESTFCWSIYGWAPPKRWSIYRCLSEVDVPPRNTHENSLTRHVRTVKITVVGSQVIHVPRKVVDLHFSARPIKIRGRRGLGRTWGLGITMMILGSSLRKVTVLVHF